MIYHIDRSTETLCYDTRVKRLVQFGERHQHIYFLYHLAKSLATVSLGQVTKAAECVPDVYVSDAMENALSPTVLSSWNINTLRSTV